jgi:hypothetical protein
LPAKLAGGPLSPQPVGGRSVRELAGRHVRETCRVMSGRRAEWVTSGARLPGGKGHEDGPLLVPERHEERLPAVGQPELDDAQLVPQAGRGLAVAALQRVAWLGSGLGLGF